MKRNGKIEDFLKEKGETLLIPENLKPDQMDKILRKCGKSRRKFTEQSPMFRWRNIRPALVTAACFLLAMGTTLLFYQPVHTLPDKRFVQKEAKKQETAERDMSPANLEEEQKLQVFSGKSYEEIYACLSETWRRQEEQRRRRDIEEAEAEAADSVGELQMSKEAFGTTNRQVEQVDEADQIKNDGRYLYQIVRKEQEEANGENMHPVGIQIVDTKDGLKETAFLNDFESLEEFYVWNDLLITVENKSYHHIPLSLSAGKMEAAEDIATDRDFRMEQGYHEISIYQTVDKSRPRKMKTFTLQGSYECSRVSEGYFYGISRFTAVPGEGEQDYDAYIPFMDGKRMEADRIYCPENTNGADYLVLVSIDLSDPSSFADSRAVLSGSGIYYVNMQNIYVASYRSAFEREPSEKGLIEDATSLLRFSYRKGRFYAQAEGEIPGRLKSSFSMDEYEDNLRMVSTIQEYQVREITDDRTGERLGYDYAEAAQSNALYILDPSLQIIGKMEGLAEGEQIYSSRFLGDSGYFVTFRQTDPLFAVDLSDPEQPEVLGELKVSGFSEYLHFYGEHMLLGIGMEADEETGQEQGMKLSMFDISNPKELKEVSRYSLAEYDYSEALYDHRAVLIDVEENIIGFQAEGSRQGERQEDYLLYAYQNHDFVRTLKIATGQKDHEYYRVRGSFIGDTLYLLYENGTVRAYSRDSGELLDEI